MVKLLSRRNYLGHMLAFVAAACGSETTEPQDVEGVTGDWCEAQVVLRDACQQCHAAELIGGAPMPLVEHADTQGLSVIDGMTPITDLIADRIHDDKRPMPPTSQSPLTEDQKATLDAWIAAGSPAAADGAKCTTGGPKVIEEKEFEWPQDCEEFYKFVAGDGTPHLVEAETETHPQFYFDVPWGGEGPVQALAMKPITDNQRVLHHWILYQGNSFLTGWAPGGQPNISRDGMGTFMPNSGQLRLDMHYYNLGNDEDELDSSGVEVCITRHPRPVTATTFPFTASATAGASQRSVNANTCTVESSDPVYLIGSSPHMHQLGAHAKLEILRVDGSVEIIHDAPFAFEDQKAVNFEPIELRNGDQVRTTCVFENDTPKAVRFGDGSDDEMCFNFATYYPMCGMRCTGGDLLASVISISQGGGCPGR